MSNTSEKLIELQKAAIREFMSSTTDVPLTDFITDYLIANGATVQRWIPVSERLPEEHESIFVKFQFTDSWMPGMFLTTSNDVIAAVICENGSRKTAIARTQDGKWNMCYIPGGKEVTHWMPLPEPPEEVRQ